MLYYIIRLIQKSVHKSNGDNRIECWQLLKNIEKSEINSPNLSVQSKFK